MTKSDEVRIRQATRWQPSGATGLGLAVVGDCDAWTLVGLMVAALTSARLTDSTVGIENDELVGIRRGTWLRAERHASAERKKTHELPQPYSTEQIAEIDACSMSEQVRGAETRYWEDVQVGEELPTIVRGPLRVSNLIVWPKKWAGACS